jgi:opacity protein-like surface antigen
MKLFTVLLACVAICTLTATAASAETNVYMRGIGLKAGVVNPENLDATLGIAAVFDLGTLHQNVALESYAGYWSQTVDEYGGEFSVRDFAIGGKAKYMFQTSNPTVQPYAGAGLGLHFVGASVETDPVYFGGSLILPGYSASETDVEFGLDLGGGLRIDRGGRFAFIGDAWFSVVSGDASHFSVMAGAVYMLGR